MTRYRLYVGRKVGSSGTGRVIPMSEVDEAATALFEGATVYASAGIWRGQSEPSSVIEVVELPGTGFDLRAQVHAAAVTLARQLGQDAILVTEEKIESALFLGPKGEVQP